MPQNTPMGCGNILPTRRTHSEKSVFHQNRCIYPFPYQLQAFVSPPGCLRRFGTPKKEHSWIFGVPQVPKPAQTSTRGGGDDGGDGGGDGGTIPANPTPLPNVPRDQISRKGNPTLRSEHYPETILMQSRHPILDLGPVNHKWLWRWL